MENLKPDVSSFTRGASEIVFPFINLEAKDEFQFQPSCSVEQEECNSLSDPLSSDVLDSQVKFECKEEVKDEITIEENWVPSEAADVAATSRSIEVLRRGNSCIPNDCSRSSYASVSLMQKTCETKQFIAQITEESKLHILPSNTHSSIAHAPANIRRFTGKKTVSRTLSSNKVNKNAKFRNNSRVEKILSCSVCSAKFSYSSQLKSHTRVHTGERPFPCTVCPAKFSCSSSLKSHTRIHTGEKPFSCTVCSAKFSSSSKLKSHSRVHTGEKPFSCTVCSGKFSSSYYLKIHSRMHTGERPFSCTVCSAKFICRTDLNIHTRLHTGERPFSCTVCSAKFICGSDLTKHTRIHTGERPFPCTVCSAKFKSRTNLKTHTRIHTGERLVSCEHCSSTFRCKVSLIKHMRLHMVDTSVNE